LYLKLTYLIGFDILQYSGQNIPAEYYILINNTINNTASVKYNPTSKLCNMFGKNKI